MHGDDEDLSNIRGFHPTTSRRGDTMGALGLPWMAEPCYYNNIIVVVKAIFLSTLRCILGQFTKKGSYHF